MRPHIFDTKLRLHFRHYAAQVTIVVVVLMAVLWAEHLVAGPQLARAFIIGAVAATGFILFISPHREVASPRHVLGGYTIGMLIAGTLAFAVQAPLGLDLLGRYPDIFPITAAVAMGLAMFTMAATDTEHPPAIGGALAISVHPFNWHIIAFVAGSIVTMVALHRLLRDRLVDLF